jgi:WD40 repeat protein
LKFSLGGIDAVSSYQVGGSLPMDARSYVARSADSQLYNALKQAEFCYVLNSRQMGKSSLMVRTLHHLEEDGYCCAAIDMTRISGEKVTLEQWYKGLAVELLQSFNLFDKINFKQWWNERQDLSTIQKLSQFIEEILLVEIKDQNDFSEPPIVIFFDEIDSVLSLDFSINDFFALIRFCYNQRSLNPSYRRLTFALFGVATPSDLINNYRRTPFNIGQSIQLTGFNWQESQPLLLGLKEVPCNPQLILKEILNWTNGQPFLTQKICYLIRSSPNQYFVGNEAYLIQNLVQDRIINNWQTQDEPEHLKTIRARLLSNEKKAGSSLALYQQILQRGFIPVDDSVEQQELLLSGLITKQEGKLKVSNLIYQEIFNVSWVETQLSQLRPYSQNFQAWQKSQYTDKSRLLRGNALKDAKKWSRGKNLSNLDYRFLASSEELDREEVQQVFEAERAQQIETRLIEKQKTARIQRYFLIALSIALLAALGSGIIAYRQYRLASLNEIKALSNYSEALFASDRRLEALISAIKVKKKWLKLDYHDQNTDQQIDSVLRQAVYGIDEYNRLSGHIDPIFGVDISPDGQLIATAGADRTVKLWQFDGSLLNTFTKHDAAVWDVAFSPDGQIIASASRDKTVKLWRQRDGRLLNTFKGHQDSVFGVSFSPDGQLIASASRDKTVKLWRQHDGKLIDTLSAHSGPVRKAVFSPDGQMLATASEDKTIKLWELDNQGRFQPTQTLIGHTREVRDVAFSPDGRTIASVSYDNTAKLWRRDTGNLLHTLEGHSSPIVGVVFHPNDQIITTASWDGSVKTWNLEGTLLKTINIDKARIWDIDISPDGKNIATSSQQKMIKLSRLDSPFFKVLRGHKNPIMDVAISSQGTTISTIGDDNIIKFWNQSGSLLTTFKNKQNAANGISWSPNSDRFISGNWDGTINFFDVKRLDKLKVRLIRTIHGHKAGIWRVAASPNGKLIATASEDRTVKLWDWNGILRGSLIGHKDVIRRVVFSPDSKIVATASYDKTVKIWNIQGNILATLKGHNKEVLALDISSDGKVLASADNNGIVKLWKISLEKSRIKIYLNKTLKGHTEGVRQIAFSPDGQLIASGSQDSTVKLWNRNGKLLKTFYGHSKPVWSVAFNPDGKTIVSASEDKTAIIWNINQMINQNLLAAGCSQIQDYLRTNIEVKSSDRLLCKS